MTTNLLGGLLLDDDDTDHADPACPKITGTAVAHDGRIGWLCTGCVDLGYDECRYGGMGVPAAQAALDAHEASGRSTGSQRTNRFAAECAKCRGRVAVGGGSLIRDGRGWAVKHTGECPAPVAAAPVESVRSNRFAGACAKCGGHVPAETGRLAGSRGAWTVEHAECPAVPDVVDVPAAGPLPDVPAGRYAVDTEAGHLAFYRVDRPTEGRWAGYTFVKVQASDELHRVRGRAAASILAKIAVDPSEAMLRYGRMIGACGHCGRTLTDETSRARGIGPVCAARLGWAA